MLSDHSDYERVQPLQGVTAHVADVQAERELVNVAMEMLLRNLMIDAVHSALEHSPDGFNAVRAHAVLGVDSSRVIDRFVPKEQTVKADVSGRFVRKDRGTYFDVGMDSRLQRGHVGSLNRHRYGTSAALPKSYDGSLADAPTSSLELFVFVLVALFPADEALIHFDNAAQLVKIIARAACLAQTLQHEPCRLLGNANLLAELQAGDALACGYEQIHRVEPFVQGDVAALEDRPCANREIERTGIATIEANLGLLPDALTALALGAKRPVRPEARFEVQSRRLSGREHLEQLERTNRAFAHKSPPFTAAPVSIAMVTVATVALILNMKRSKLSLWNNSACVVNHELVSLALPNQTCTTFPATYNWFLLGVSLRNLCVFHRLVLRNHTAKVDNSLHFVKNFSRFVLKGLATHVYNSH